MSAALGVCSWSLRPASPGELVAAIKACGVSAVQLALDPVRTGQWDEIETVALLDGAGIEIVSGMMATAGEDYTTLDTIRETGGVRPDHTWPENLAAARGNAELAARIGVNLVTFHAGFIPHDQSDPEWAKLIARLQDLVDVFHGCGVRVAFETGQESAETLLEAMDALNRPTAGINFDPANMILYNMGDPADALSKLSPRVEQIHIKDAVHTKSPGEWGEEVPAGTGAVDWSAFFKIVRDRLADCNLVIEREAGEQRVKDVRTAAALVRANANWIEQP
ncbi:MAG: sugar phosphate isomerase/epimerase [Phycisphaerales bacterium]|nr:TIM barrel protein [Planctomycetota bacterium]MCH8508332.1 sugar phosphate isomerase/epimerase [Phycisphaerales bacterium]